jgi:chaperonin GroES
LHQEFVMASAPKSSIKPLGNHVLLQRSSPEDTSKGGIILPEKAKEKPKEGKIVAVGNGKVMEDGKRAKIQVQAGDRVLFNSYAGTEVKVGGAEYIVMEESEILAILK